MEVAQPLQGPQAAFLAARRPAPVGGHELLRVRRRRPQPLHQRDLRLRRDLRQVVVEVVEQLLGVGVTGQGRAHGLRVASRGVQGAVAGLRTEVLGHCAPP